MRRHNRLFTMLIAGSLAGFCFAPGVVRAADSDRADTWEFSLPIRYVNSESITAKGGSTVDINGDLGWGLGFGYNLSEKVNVGFEFTWMDANYDATIQSGDVVQPPGFPVTLGGTLEATTGAFTGQYNFMEKTITPFVTGGLGWTFIDSNIPTGPTQGVCWWDPWWGYVCDTWQPTASDSYFSYSAGVGVRGEMTESVYLEGAYNFSWLDFDQTDTTSFSGFRVEFGWKF